MRKNLTENQKLKGAKYIENEKRRIRKQYQQVIRFKNMDKSVKVSYLYHEDVKQLKTELNEMKLYLAELQRKYL